MTDAAPEEPSKDRLHTVIVDLPEAKTLADAASVHQDLKYVEETLSRLAEQIDQRPDDSLLARALWSSALVAYARCFTSRVKYGDHVVLSRDDAVTVVEGGGEFHDWIMDLRNKHIVHSVNPYEQVKVGVLLAPPSQTRAVVGAATLSSSLVVTSKEGVANFYRLVTQLRALVARRCESLQQEVVKAATQLPLDKLYEMPPVGITVPGPEESGRARRKA